MKSSNIQVKVLAERPKGQAFRIRVSGARTVRCTFEHGGKSCLIDFTLNGEYTRTPNKAFSMIKEPPTAEAGVQALSYQVLLLEKPPKAEFQIFKFHEDPVVKAETCETSLHLSREDFIDLTETEPRDILAALDTLGLPESVSKFLLQAKKCTSS